MVQLGRRQRRLKAIYRSEIRLRVTSATSGPNLATNMTKGSEISSATTTTTFLTSFASGD